MPFAGCRLNQQQFCDEMFRGYQHLVNFDFKHARKETRKYACTFDTEVTTQKDGLLRPKDYPEEYGFNAIKLDDKVDLNARSFGDVLTCKLKTFYFSHSCPIVRQQVTRSHR